MPSLSRKSSADGGSPSGTSPSSGTGLTPPSSGGNLIPKSPKPTTPVGGASSQPKSSPNSTSKLGSPSNNPVSALSGSSAAREAAGAPTSAGKSPVPSAKSSASAEASKSSVSPFLLYAHLQSSPDSPRAAPIINRPLVKSQSQPPSIASKLEKTWLPQTIPRARDGRGPRGFMSRSMLNWKNCLDLKVISFVFYLD